MRAGTGRNQETNGVKSFQPTARRNLKSLRQKPSKAPKFSQVSKRQTAVTAAKTEINDSCRTHTSSSLEDFEESGDNAAIEESAALLNFRTVQPFRATVFQRWSTLHIKRILSRSLYLSLSAMHSAKPSEPLTSSKRPKPT